MKKLTIFLTVFFSVFLLQAETIANVTSCKNLTLTIDRGAMDGVVSGLKGIVKAVYKEPSGEYTINIGIFTVRKVYERTAEVVIEIGKGLNPADARYVVFDPDLVPSESKSETALPAKVVESADWHLEQGDKAANEGKFKSAQEHYQKALALEPKNLVAQEKCSEIKKKIAGADRKVKFNEYLKKADANYEKNNVKYAFLYLIEALRMFPEGSSEVKSRLTVMVQEYPQEIEVLLTEKAKEMKDVREQIDNMLDNRSASKPAVFKTKAQEVKGKADKIYQNEKGFWEAVFLNNITMVYIPEGEFTIGSPAREGDADEHPAHKVFLSGYWIGKSEITFSQFDAFCQETGLEKPEDEGWGRGERPVIYVSWKEANDFCAWLEKKTGFAFRLPTEAEWEKAARDRFPWGNAAPASHLANFNKYIMKTNTVGSYPKGASPYGVLDMAGNVWEWLSDWYDAGYYENSQANDPQGPQRGSERVVRGGSWAHSAEFVRSANRSQENPNSKLNILGFRIALSCDRQQLDAMLGKTPGAEPAPINANAQETEYSEPFLKKIAGKAEKIYQNEQSFWEAIFLKNITMIYVPEGEFTIGSPSNQGDDDEHPAHKVFVAGFWIGRTEVTFEQYDIFCRETGRGNSEDEGWGRGKRPAIYVSWNDANDYCAWLTKKTGLKFRLPREAEWEKAARDYYPWGSTLPAAALANFNKNSMKTSPVGSCPKGASPYGILDMAGNVWEWMGDWYDSGFYRNSPFKNPRGPESGAERVVRGGSWANDSEFIRSANRSQEDPASRLNILGFRLALDSN